MAKKYLLYIHNDKRFEAEKNKSELVNSLLDRHYGNNVYTSESEQSETVYTPVVEKLARIKPDWRPCTHGADPKLCRHAKPGKRCK